ncbi:MAG: hypothetical protein ACRD1B_03130 [Thermoanaerobaculia bacterium]
MDLQEGCMDRGSDRGVQVTPAIIVLGLLCIGGIILGRSLKPGYFDLLSPMCALYLMHGVARAIVVTRVPPAVRVHPIVQSADSSEIAWAVWLMAAGIVSFSAAYGLAWRQGRKDSVPAQLTPIGQGKAVAVLCIGLGPRVLLVLASRMGWDIPPWALTPVETLGWASLAGVFFLSLAFAQASRGLERREHGAIFLLGFFLTVITAPNISWSREALLQPVLAAVFGWLIGKRVSAVKTVGGVVAVVVPILVFGHGVKAAAGVTGAETSASRVAMFEETRQTYDSLLDLGLAAIVDRTHGLDSLIVCRYWVPDRRPFEPGSVWVQILTSAFVPRMVYPEKKVGWAERFAVEFWGAKSTGVGISHLGNFYIYGGVLGCLMGMLTFGAGLGDLVARLANRGDSLALCAVLLVGFVVLQIDRDLEVVLGGAFKILVLGYLWAKLSSARRVIRVQGPDS